MLIAIAIINAVLWSGVIVFLLFRAMRQQTGLEERLQKMESGSEHVSATQNSGDA